MTLSTIKDLGFGVTPKRGTLLRLRAKLAQRLTRWAYLLHIDATRKETHRIEVSRLRFPCATRRQSWRAAIKSPTIS